MSFWQVTITGNSLRQSCGRAKEKNQKYFVPLQVLYKFYSNPVILKPFGLLSPLHF